MVLFGGRLGTYKYLDMHMAIGSALSHVREQAPAALRRGRRADVRRSRRMTTGLSTDATGPATGRRDGPAGCCSARPAGRPRLRRRAALRRHRGRAVLDADKYAIGGNRSAKDLNNAAIRAVDLDRRAHPPRPDRVAHRAPGPVAASGSRSAPTSTRFAGQLLAALDRRRRRHPRPSTAERPRRHRDRLPVDGQRPLPAGRRRRRPRTAAEHASPSTCR